MKRPNVNSTCSWSVGKASEGRGRRRILIRNKEKEDRGEEVDERSTTDVAVEWSLKASSSKVESFFRIDPLGGKKTSVPLFVVRAKRIWIFRVYLFGLVFFPFYFLYMYVYKRMVLVGWVELNSRFAETMRRETRDTVDTDNVEESSSPVAPSGRRAVNVEKEVGR